MVRGLPGVVRVGRRLRGLQVPESRNHAKLAAGSKNGPARHAATRSRKVEVLKNGPMQPRTLYRILLSGGLAFLCSCEPPGKPKEEDRWKPPSELKNFAELFDTNCRACHSNGQALGASISMNNPPYLAIVPKEVVHKSIEEGIRGTAMPGFSAMAGGLLTEEQINIL